MNKTFKFRIYSNDSQKTLIHKTLVHNRYINEI